ncbi:hypothetical protein FCV25MIE_17294 [Fagus crenata]
MSTSVAPLRTILRRNSKCGAYQSRMLSAGTCVLLDAEDDDNGFNLSSSSYSVLICFSKFFWVCEASQVLVIWWLRWGVGRGGLRVFWRWPRSEFFLGL